MAFTPYNIACWEIFVLYITVVNVSQNYDRAQGNESGVTEQSSLLPPSKTSGNESTLSSNQNTDLLSVIVKNSD